MLHIFKQTLAILPIILLASLAILWVKRPPCHACQGELQVNNHPADYTNKLNNLPRYIN